MSLLIWFFFIRAAGEGRARYWADHVRQIRLGEYAVSGLVSPPPTPRGGILLINAMSIWYPDDNISRRSSAGEPEHDVCRFNECAGSLVASTDEEVETVIVVEHHLGYARFWFYDMEERILTGNLTLSVDLTDRGFRFRRLQDDRAPWRTLEGILRDLEWRG